MSKVYQVKRIAIPDQDIDWSQAFMVEDFSYPWNKDEQCPTTIFRALWDEVKFHFSFQATDSDIKTFIGSHTKRDVDHSDRVEIFFMANQAMSPYYCLEMDPLGRVMDFKAFHYRQFDFEFSWPGLAIDAMKSNEGYRVTGSIPLESLKSFGILRNNEISAGLYRANCIKLVSQSASFKWISWVDPETPEPDFHVPASFGKFILLD